MTTLLIAPRTRLKRRRSRFRARNELGLIATPYSAKFCERGATMTALPAFGGAMADERTPVDLEFERLQTWYRPSRVRRMLEDYRAILYPHRPEREDERGLPRRYRVSYDPPIQDRVHDKAEIDKALTWLYFVERDVDAAEAIHLYYLTLDSRGQVMTQEAVARIMRCTERTVRNRIKRGIDLMAWRMGWLEGYRSDGKRVNRLVLAP